MTNNQKKNKLAYFLSQPHQPFFLLGIVSAVVFMILFLLSYRGIIHTNPTLLHSYSMIFIVFTNFFYGFTLTTFTRFSSQMPIAQKRYITLFVLNSIAFVSMIAQVWIEYLFFATTIAMAISFAYLIRIFYEIYQKAPEPKNDQYMIIFAFGMGTLSNILFILSQIPCTKCKADIFLQYGVQTGIYLYMLLLATVIAFRMVPFFSRVMSYQKSSYLHLALVLLLTLHVIISQLFVSWLWLVDLALALMLTYEIMKMDLPFPNPDPLLWGLHIALYWLGFGFLISSAVEFFSAHYGYYSLYMPIHLLMLGFLTSILIAFGTRVTLGHGGALLQVGKATKALFVFVQIVVAIRVILSITASEGKIFPLFDIAVTAWIVLFLWWSYLYGKILVAGSGR